MLFLHPEQLSVYDWSAHSKISDLAVVCQEQPVAFSSKCFTTSEASFADHGVKKPSWSAGRVAIGILEAEISKEAFTVDEVHELAPVLPCAHHTAARV